MEMGWDGLVVLVVVYCSFGDVRLWFGFWGGVWGCLLSVFDQSSICLASHLLLIF